MNYNSKFLMKSDDEIAEDLGARAKALRIQLKMSQEEFAKKSGIACATYGKFERTGQIGFVSFLTIMRYLGRIAEADRLLKEDDAQKKGLKKFILEKEKTVLPRARFRKINPNTRKDID